MADDISSDLAAEIEGFRAELRARAERHEREMKQPSALDLPSLNVSELDLPQVRALISQRYEQARIEKRLTAVEKRLAEIETRNG